MTRPLPLNTNVGDFGDVRRALQRIELNMRMPPLNNLSGSAAVPTVTTFDRNAGYTAGSLWKDTTGEVHVLTNDATGASEWITQPVTSHVLLDGDIHSDTAADAVTRGSLVYGNSTPEWDELVKGADGQYLRSDGTDVAWQGLNIVDDTSPELGGDLALAATGINSRRFNFNHGSTTFLTIQNVGAGLASLIVEGSIRATVDLLADGNIIVSGTVDGRDVATDGTKLDGIASGAIANVVEDTSPQAGGDFDLNGFDLVIGDNFFNIEFNSASTRGLTLNNLGAGVASLNVVGSISTTGGGSIVSGLNLTSLGQTVVGTALTVVTTSLLKGNVTIGDGTAVDRTLTFNALANDGIITWDEDPGQFLFSHTINVTDGDINLANGDIIVSGTVDGRDVATDGTKLDGIASGAIANLVEDTTPELGGNLALAASGVALRFFNFDHGSTATLIIQNVGAGDASLIVEGSIQATVDLLVNGNIIVSGTVDGVDIAARDHDNEGTALLSTGEAGGTKFLREDGDGTCSWQAAAGGGDLVDDLTPQLGADLDCNTFDIQFDDATGIRDDSGNEQMIFKKTASAITHFEIANAAAGQGPILSVSGETNVDFNLLAKGTGILKLGVAGNIGLFASVAYIFGPNENKKAHLGSASKKWATAHFGEKVDANEGGVRGAYYAAALSNPPTDAQLDSGVGAPASLGSGFKVMVKDTTSGNYWFIGTDGTDWWRTEPLTVLS